MDIVTYALLNGKIKDYASNVDEWLEENVDPATGYVLDRSLQMENAAAPADMVGDINVEVGDLKNTLSHKADVIYDTAIGDIVSFPDGADSMPVKALTIDGVESATVMRTGANIWDEEWEIGTIDPATGENSSGDTRWRSKNLIPIRPDTDYCYRLGADGNYKTTGRVCYYDANGDYLSGNAAFPGGGASFTNPAVFHTPANAYYMRFSPAGGTTYENDTAINYPAADTQYHPYQGNTFEYPSETVTTLYGVNNIWSDAGPVNVTYCADTKLYIQKINTPTDDDMIADAQIASGKYFIVNNNLYISTAAILAGDPIKPGTNCTLTNLAAALNALNS